VTAAKPVRLAIDIGGTFTDLVAEREGGARLVAKVLTTPDDHARGVMAAIEKAAVDLREVSLFLHGSTIAINTVIERKGAKTALLTTRGFRDVYEIGRSNRPDAYNLFFERPEPLVPRRLRLEVSERVTARGEVHRPLDREQAAGAIASLREEGAEAVAVCFLHSYANPSHERIVGEIASRVHPEAYVALSHRILREYREYERTSTTVVNAYVGPVVARYLGSLGERLRARGFSGTILVMQSAGGVMALETAIELPVRMMESGPVAGVIGAAKVARELGCERAIAFDMGGTTAKASLTRDGSAGITSHYFIGGYASGHPVMLPVVDIVEVGSGGGSIAWVDGAGGLKVGPASAGADPGPACYGRGGRRPTVTDANLLLGRLGERSLLGGEMILDPGAAAAAVEREVARPLGLDVTEACVGILRVANAHMALALRAVSVERGQDPRDFALVAFGGAGPLHASTLARELGIPKVIVPELPGEFSAAGMLACELRHDYVRTLVRDFDRADPQEVEAALAELVEGGLETLRREPRGASHRAAIERALELRYRGQEYTVSVPLGAAPFVAASRPEAAARFHELHRLLYGHAAPGEPLELVAVRVTVRAEPREAPRGRALAGGARAPEARAKRRVYLGEAHGFVETPVFSRDALGPGAEIEGPAVVEEHASTTILLPGDRLRVAESGELVIDTRAEGP
jgi:N-methylhydantoinase A